MSANNTQEARRRIGAELRFLREGENLEQREIAEKIGIIQNTVSRIENGKCSVGIDTLIKYAEVFGKKITIV